MSALGQKQTFALQKVMSALPPKADMCGAKTNVLRNPCNYEGQYRCRPGSTTVAAPHGRTAMVRDVLIVLIGIVLPIILLLFLAWHYLL